MNLHDDDFTLFGLPRRFTLDAADLEQRWKTLQRQAHPDRFAAQGAAAQRVAMQWSARINEAYQRLKHPTSRGAYLCELLGAGIEAHTNTAMPAEFLMQQMQLREQADEADSPAELAAVAAEAAAMQQHWRTRLAEQLDGGDTAQSQDAAAAAASVRALMFADKLEQDIQRRRAALASAST